MNETKVERLSDTELQVTRVFDAPPNAVFKAWTTPELLLQWWAPKSFGLNFISCELDARVGGTYSFEFGHPSFELPMAFVGRYLEVAENQRLVWTNEESENGAISTVTFVEKDGKTYLTMHDKYPSKEALGEAIESGSTSGFGESFRQLDELIQ